jgi:hypothetical protein
MADSLFEARQEEVAEPQLDPNKKYLEDLVGTDKKFKDVESLAKGKWYADAQIEIQNKRMDQLRADYLALKADYDARAKLEEYLDRIQTKPQNTQSNEETQPVKESNVPAMRPEDIDRRFVELRSKEKAEQNFNTVMAKLKEQYANNWQNVLMEKTEELGLTAEEVDAMARRSPKLFFKTMDLDQPRQQSPYQAPPKSDTRFAPQGAPKKTWTYYQELFKKDPKLYYNPKMTQEMVESAAELGDAFQDGDFKKYGDSF